LDGGPGGFAGDPVGLAGLVGRGGRGDAAVEGHGDFHEDEGALRLAPMGEGFVEAAGFWLAEADGGLDAGGLQGLEAVAGDGGVGVDGGGDDAADAGGDEGLGAGRGAAGVVAGLEGDVGGAALDRVPGLLCGFESGDFGVVALLVLVPAFAGDLAGTIQEDAADGGIGRGEGDASAG